MLEYFSADTAGKCWAPSDIPIVNLNKAKKWKTERVISYTMNHFSVTNYQTFGAGQGRESHCAPLLRRQWPCATIKLKDKSYPISLSRPPTNSNTIFGQFQPTPHSLRAFTFLVMSRRRRRKVFHMATKCVMRRGILNRAKCTCSELET